MLAVPASLCTSRPSAATITQHQVVKDATTPSSTSSCRGSHPGKLADPWIAVDKLQHLVLSAAVVVGVFVTARRALSLGRSSSLAAGILTSLCAGILKELGDHLKWWPGNLSYRDFVADLLGIALAAAGILLHHHYSTAASTSASAALAGLASRLQPTTGTAAYRPVPTTAADIEMGAAPAATEADP